MDQSILVVDDDPHKSAHGGTIRLADSAEGTAFALTIPLADARAS